jgi:hypothetical protein
VSKSRAPWALFGILFLSYGIWRTAGLIVASLCLTIGYFASIRLHPRIACRKCKGRGRFSGFIYTWAWRWCRKCLGSGRKVRWGSGAWGSPRMREEATATRRAVREAPRGRWVE